VACEGLQTRDDRERKGVTKKGRLDREKKKGVTEGEVMGEFECLEFRPRNEPYTLNSRMLAGCMVTPNTPCRPLRPQSVVEECAHNSSRCPGTGRGQARWDEEGVLLD
jgi:hypothetical protein